MKIFDMVVIGAGPAGIAAGVEAKIKNKEVIVLEKADAICQTLVKFYKEGKRVDKAYKGCDSTNYGHINFEDGTRESTIEIFQNAIKEHNLEVKLSSEVESVKKDGENFIVSTANENYICKNVVIAIGRMGKPNKPSYTLPITLTKIINFNANSASQGEKILVVGGGNSAAEYAIDLAKNNDVTLCYRKETFSRLNDINLSDIQKAFEQGSVKAKLGIDIISIEDESGKAKVNFTNDTNEIYDRIIYAIGGSTPLDFLQKCSIEVDEKGVPSFDENKESNVKGLFVAGDIASKNGASIVVGLNDSFKICDHLYKC
ncbi:NAD(P)-binding domain-containing protein [Campylobacter lari]|uniref:NAD(P)-binding domain-containing protein n=1 Tax=Campylobacter lari TaxID=201 RepID=UPI0010789F6B|nr:NAD(P)-binding domain-containing protein [Campylobacter lari]EAC1839535.1 FAD-binding protein [Campylobacter lari]EAH7781221.1 FAD-binding protein [Campylobacter lari]EAH8420033.1 FAD-binding protein [Campylobacter lari]EAI0903496.1 FAD-binding protein [Campylobacter lari]EAI2358039.1 FAD-binding protein [Campylobacter lari]